MQDDTLVRPLPRRGVPRFRVRVLPSSRDGSRLATDVEKGLATRPKRLPPKHFYDDRGSRLFDQICDTPEYYLTRTELTLLERMSDGLVRRVRPTHVIELGSGTARKTRAIFRAAERAGLRFRYVPFDVSESIVFECGEKLLREFPWLDLQGLVGDYERDLHELPEGMRRLLLFIGGTIGNFEPGEAVRFLRRVAETMGADDRLLLGTDLIKPVDVLEAAYNDARGVTAAFNKNMLTVMNRELGADFSPELFEHVAFFDEEKAQVEMHLRSVTDQRVNIPALASLVVRFERGETIHTEISRKFSRETVEATLREADLELLEWHTPPNEYFGLSVSRRSPR